MKQKILFVDDDQELWETWKPSLEEYGYKFRFESTIRQARQAYDGESFDLAVIDLRLEDKDNPDDFSGIELAKELKDIPKILLTAHRMPAASIQETTSILDIPLFMGFAEKDQGPDNLVDMIREVLDKWPTLKYSKRAIDHIKDDHENVRKHADYYFLITCIASIIGFLIIIAGVVLSWWRPNQWPIALIVSSAGLIFEALAYLFFRQLERANERMDLYHEELVQVDRFELLVAHCERFPVTKQDTTIEGVIDTVAKSWFTIIYSKNYSIE